MCLPVTVDPRERTGEVINSPAPSAVRDTMRPWAAAVAKSDPAGLSPHSESLTQQCVDAMLIRMANVCDGCGERATVTRYWPDGLLAGRTLCRDCVSGRKKMTRLSSLVAFKFRLAQVLPPDNKSTAPTLRLMMAVD